MKPETLAASPAGGPVAGKAAPQPGQAWHTRERRARLRRRPRGGRRLAACPPTRGAATGGARARQRGLAWAPTLRGVPVYKTRASLHPLLQGNRASGRACQKLLQILSRARTPAARGCSSSPPVQNGDGAWQETIETPALRGESAGLSSGRPRPLRGRLGGARVPAEAGARRASKGPSRRTASRLHGAGSSEPVTWPAEAAPEAGEAEGTGRGRRKGREAEGIAPDPATTGLSWSRGPGLAHAPPDPQAVLGVATATPGPR